MILYEMNAMSWVSAILTGLCLAWCVGLGIFVLVKKIIEIKKARAEIKKHEKERDRKYGTKKD